MEERRKQLEKLVNENNSAVLSPLIDRIIFLENQIESLEKLPMLKVNPNNPEQQKSTPAAKQYKEFLQQYTNVMKLVSRVVGVEQEEELSPLRMWAESRQSNAD